MQTTNTAAATLSAGFIAAAAFTAERIPVAKVEVRWNGVDWIDESDHTDGDTRLIGFEFTNQLAKQTEGLVPIGTVDMGSITFRNDQWRYSAHHEGGDNRIRPYLSGDRGVTEIKCRISVGFIVGDPPAPEYVWSFTGYLHSVEAMTAKKTATFKIRDNANVMVQKKISTAAIAINQSAGQIVTTAATAADFDGTVMADVDPIVIPYSWIEDEGTFDDAGLAVTAVAGRLWVDGPGNLRFESASHWLTHNTKVWTFAAGSKQELTPVGDPADLVTEVVVEYAPRVPGQAGVLWTLEKPTYIRPGAVETVAIRLPQPALAIFYKLDGSTKRPYDDDFYVTSAGGMNMIDFVPMSLEVTAQGATLTIANRHPSYLACLRWFQLRGVPLVGGPSEEIKQSTGAATNYRTRSERGNPYIQTRSQAQLLASLLADRHKKLQETFVLRNVAGVPQLELGDRVGVSDGRAVSTEREGFVTVIAHAWKTPERGSLSQVPVYSQTITVLDAAAFFPGSSYFKIGTTALGAGEAWY